MNEVVKLENNSGSYLTEWLFILSFLMVLFDKNPML